MKVFIVRHGQTDYNVLKTRFGGRVDIPLNKAGIEEAGVLKDKLSTIKFDKVYSSPLRRALQTAKIITDGTIIVDDRLTERSNGDLEGRLRSEIPDKVDFKDPVFIKKHNIETDDSIEGRVSSFFEDISTLENCENVLIVTHAGTGMYIRKYFDGEPVNGDITSYKLENCGVLKRSLEKGKKYIKNNDN